MGRGVRLIVSDFAISFMWVWASVMVKMLIYKPLGITGNDAKHEVVKCGMSVFNMFVFAWFGKLTNGGAYNPLMLLSTAVSADFPTFLFTLAARIPAQVFISILLFIYFSSSFLSVVINTFVCLFVCCIGDWIDYWS